MSAFLVKLHCEASTQLDNALCDAGDAEVAALCDANDAVVAPLCDASDAEAGQPADEVGEASAGSECASVDIPPTILGDETPLLPPAKGAADAGAQTPEGGAGSSSSSQQ